MRRILFLLVVMVFSSVMAQATSYSCRDNQGHLYMTDNLQSLPAECLGRTNTVNGENSGSLSFVAEQESPQNSGADFQKVVDEATQKQKLRKEWLDNLLPRVERVIAQYHQAAQQIYDTTRRGRLKYRDIITRAKEQKQQAIAEKQKILAEISGPDVSRKDRRIITSKLDEIEE